MRIARAYVRSDATTEDAATRGRRWAGDPDGFTAERRRQADWIERALVLAPERRA